MATQYDEWKTTEPDSGEADWVADRQSDLAIQWRSDPQVYKDFIIQAMCDDYEDVFAGALSAFMISVNGMTSRASDACAASTLWDKIRNEISPRIMEEAKVRAQAEWDTRLTEKPHDDV